MTTQLYWYWTTNPQKIRLALEEWGIGHELIHIQLGKGENRTAEYRSIHPKGSVPTLIHNGNTYWESNAALLGLALQYPTLLPPIASPAYAQALNLLFMEACIFQRWAGIHFIEKKINPILGKSTNLETVSEAHQRLQSSFDILEQQLQGRNHLFEHFSIVDCAFAPWLPYLDLSEYPNMIRWLVELRKRDSWIACGFRD